MSRKMFLLLFHLAFPIAFVDPVPSIYIRNGYYIGGRWFVPFVPLIQRLEWHSTFVERMLLEI